ncbi:hypothetical protein PINS_up016028 [Pythium insidiosum]|nr:hypothetical protein PINS_up016028 [Pythium insidiosum]
MLNDTEKSIECYKEVLQLDASNIEAIACLASNYFYSTTRKSRCATTDGCWQMDVNNAELWCKHRSVLLLRVAIRT